MQFVDTTSYSLPSARDAQKQVFGDYSRKDMADFTQSAYNYLMHQQDNALQIALMNYQNQYNSPQNQMLLKQAAGLSPYSSGSVQAVAPNVGSSPSFRSNGTYGKGVQQAAQAINGLLGALQTGAEIFDYAKHGSEASAWRRNLLREQFHSLSLSNFWDEYLLGIGDQGENTIFSDIRKGPRATMYKYQMDTQEQRYEQLKAIVNMIPDQEARLKSLKALDDYRLQILQGQNGAVLNINTGNETIDSVIKVLAYYMMNSSMSFRF